MWGPPVMLVFDRELEPGGRPTLRTHAFLVGRASFLPSPSPGHILSYIGLILVLVGSRALLERATYAEEGLAAPSVRCQCMCMRGCGTCGGANGKRAARARACRPAHRKGVQVVQGKKSRIAECREVNRERA